MTYGESINQRLERIEDRLEKEEASKEKKPKYVLRFKGRDQRAARRKDNHVAVVFLGRDKKMSFKVGIIKDNERVFVEGMEYGYDPTAVYWTKKFPVVVVFQWRIITAGGSVEDKRHGVSIGGDDDKVRDNEGGLNNAAQQIIIRAIESAFIEDDLKKKRFGLSAVWWIIGGVVVFYLISRAFGGG